MARIRGRDTDPEMRFRRALREAGFGYRTQVRGLPGSPDVVMAGIGMAVFVHGCFWHRHPGCTRATTPKSSTGFWSAKFDANVARDRRSIALLRGAGWHVGVVWECEVRDPESLSLAVQAVSEHRRSGSARPKRLPVRNKAVRRRRPG